MHRHLIASLGYDPQAMYEWYEASQAQLYGQQPRSGAPQRQGGTLDPVMRARLRTQQQQQQQQQPPYASQHQRYPHASQYQHQQQYAPQYQQQQHGAQAPQYGYGGANAGGGGEAGMSKTERFAMRAEEEKRRNLEQTFGRLSGISGDYAAQYRQSPYQQQGQHVPPRMHDPRHQHPYPHQQYQQQYYQQQQQHPYQQPYSPHEQQYMFHTDDYGGVDPRLVESIPVFTTDSAPMMDVVQVLGPVAAGVVRERGPSVDHAHDPYLAAQRHEELRIDRERARVGLVVQAVKRGANGVLGLKYDAGTPISATAIEVCAYGALASRPVLSLTQAHSIALRNAQGLPFSSSSMGGETRTSSSKATSSKRRLIHSSTIVSLHCCLCTLRAAERVRNDSARVRGGSRCEDSCFKTAATSTISPAATASSARWRTRSGYARRLRATSSDGRGSSRSDGPRCTRRTSSGGRWWPR